MKPRAESQPPANLHSVYAGRCERAFTGERARPPASANGSSTPALLACPSIQPWSCLHPSARRLGECPAPPT